MSALAPSAGAVRASVTHTPGLSGRSPARTADMAATADRSGAMPRPGRTMRSWPLLVLAAPAAAEVWSGWVGIAQKTGFGLVSPLPGIWPSLHLDTTITLPVGVEAYAAYALRAWLASGHAVSGRTRRFAKWSAICSFALGMAGQVSYHLLAQAGVARAPWVITTIVSCLPVLVLGMGTALAHMLRADAATGDAPDSGTAGPNILRSPPWSPGDHGGPDQDHARPDQDHARPDQDHARPDQDHAASGGTLARSGRLAGTRIAPCGDHSAATRTTGSAPRTTQPERDQARLIARRLAAAGKPVTRRALRSGGVRGSNEALNALARKVNAELAGAEAQPLPREMRPGRLVRRRT